MSIGSKVVNAPSEVYGVVELGYNLTIVMPLDKATQLLTIMGNTERIAFEYVGGRTVARIGGSLPAIGLRLLSGSDYAEGKLLGPEGSQ